MKKPDLGKFLKTRKKWILSITAIVLVLSLGCGIWYHVGHSSSEPVYVYPFHYVGMTEYWGDSQESYGPVTTDKIQTVYLSDTQTVTQVLVEAGDTVKKGDLLLTFDTTLSDLALERKRLDVEKLKLQLETAKARLWEINNMVPMVIPEPEEESPEDENLGTALSGEYMISHMKSFDGSTQDRAMICWISGSASVNDAVLEALRQASEAYRNSNAQQMPSEESAVVGEDGTLVEPIPTQPPYIYVSSYYVVFKVTQSNMSLGQTLVWQGLEVTRTDSGFSFKFFDASGNSDHMKVALGGEEEEEPEIDYGSGYTAAQIAQMRSEQQKKIKELEFNVKMADAEYKIMQTEVDDGNVYSQIDGEVVSVLTEEDAKMMMQPIVKVSGGGGFYVEGSVSELEKDKMKIGQEVTVNDWNTGMTYTGTVESVGDFPSSDSYFNGMNNPNASFYPFHVFIDGSADLQAGSYVSVMYSSAESENGVYLENPFIRTEGGKSYVLVLGGDGRLEQRWVRTGKSLWGSYTEILEGVSPEDLVAFPYGKNVKPGVEAVEGDMSNLYG